MTYAERASRVSPGVGRETEPSGRTTGVGGIEVIGAGFPRTDTLSQKAALERLGFGPCFGAPDVFGLKVYLDRMFIRRPEAAAREAEARVASAGGGA